MRPRWVYGKPQWENHNIDSVPSAEENYPTGRDEMSDPSAPGHHAATAIHHKLGSVRTMNP